MKNISVPSMYTMNTNDEKLSVPKHNNENITGTNITKINQQTTNNISRKGAYVL